MKKSEKFHAAMLAVVDSLTLDAETKLEVLTLLIGEKGTAEWVEQRDGSE